MTDLDALRERLIARRVRGGFNPAESVTMLAELEETFGPGTLACALHYQGFATPAGAEKAAARLTEGETR